MCDPLTIAGVALSAGSMLANNAAQNKVQKARSGAMEAERIRQGALDNEADAVNAGSRDRYNDFTGQQDAKAQQLGDLFAQQNQAIPAESQTDGALPTSSSNITVQEEKKQNTKAKAYGDQQAHALGNLRAFGDLFGGIQREQQQDATKVGQIGNFERGSSSVLPLELDAANSKGDGLKMFGDILGGLGTVATGAGLAKGGYSLFGDTVAKSATSAPTVLTGGLPKVALPKANLFSGVAAGQLNPYSIY